MFLLWTYMGQFSCQSIALKLLLVCLHCGKQLLAVSLRRLCRLSCFEWDILGPIHATENRKQEKHIKTSRNFSVVSLARCQGHVFFPGCGRRNGPMDRETCRGALGHAAGKSDCMFLFLHARRTCRWATWKASFETFFFCWSQCQILCRLAQRALHHVPNQKVGVATDG